MSRRVGADYAEGKILAFCAVTAMTAQRGGIGPPENIQWDQSLFVYRSFVAPDIFGVCTCTISDDARFDLMLIFL